MGSNRGRTGHSQATRPQDRVSTAEFRTPALWCSYAAPPLLLAWLPRAVRIDPAGCDHDRLAAFRPDDGQPRPVPVDPPLTVKTGPARLRRGRMMGHVGEQRSDLEARPACKRVANIQDITRRTQGGTRQPEAPG